MSEGPPIDDLALAELARDVGIVVDWIDASDRPQRVGSDALRRILPMLGFPCATRRDIVESTKRLKQRSHPTMITCDIGEPFTIEAPQVRHARIVFEDGSSADLTLDFGGGRLCFAPIDRIGYHQLEIGDMRIALAVAPKRGFGLQDVAAGDRLWGIAVQLHGLRRGGDMGIGDARALTEFAEAAALRGADAIVLGPTHALFSGDLTKYSPYSPSNRLLLNPVFADPAVLFGGDLVDVIQGEVPAPAPGAELIDWPETAARKLRRFRRVFDSFWPLVESKAEHDLVKAFQAFRAACGELLEDHARFEALYAERLRLDPSQKDWRSWPIELRDARNPAVADFAATHAREIAFHIFLQWLADASFDQAQTTARRAGMRFGLIADLAIGMESRGSLAWSRQNDTLVGLTVGAPPDLFNPRGQNWGLTTFSPLGLRDTAFSPFLTLIRAALRHAGGVRIDHVLGLARLWLIPEGAAPTEGAYLAYPFADLLRLLRIETARHQAVVIGEDLGTVPEGFRKALSDSDVAGTDVLWFARKGNKFLPSSEWRSDAIAMTTTHDLPTVAGWWRGYDIALRESCGLLGPEEDLDSLTKRRMQERQDLWQVFEAAGAVAAGTPTPEAADAVVDAALAFVASSPSPLMIAPLEDLLGMEEQPNLPGTVDEHPNWRRRYPKTVKEIFADAAVLTRISGLLRGKEGGKKR